MATIIRNQRNVPTSQMEEEEEEEEEVRRFRKAFACLSLS